MKYVHLYCTQRRERQTLQFKEEINGHQNLKSRTKIQGGRQRKYSHKSCLAVATAIFTGKLVSRWKPVELLLLQLKSLCDPRQLSGTMRHQCPCCTYQDFPQKTQKMIGRLTETMPRNIIQTFAKLIAKDMPCFNDQSLICP